MQRHVHTQPFGEFDCEFLVMSRRTDGSWTPTPVNSYFEGVELAETSEAKNVVLFKISNKEAEILKGDIDSDLTETFNVGFPEWRIVDRIS